MTAVATLIGATEEAGGLRSAPNGVPGHRRLVLRRLAVVALFLIVGAVGALVGAETTTKQYETAGAVLLIPPGAGSRVASDNPFYRLNRTAQFANVLASIALGPEGQAIVAKAAASPEFRVNRVVGTTPANSELSAQIMLSVRAPDRWAAREAAMGLITLIRERVSSLQRDAGVSEKIAVDLRVPVEPPPGSPVTGNSIRAELGYSIAAMLGLALLFVLNIARRETRARRGAAGNAARAGRDPGGRR